MTADKEEILNAGLEFALEFGPNWLKPVQSRLAAKYPDLSPEILDEYDKVCRSAMDKGHHYIYTRLEQALDAGEKISEVQLSEGLSNYLLALFPWVDYRNMGHIRSQGLYYAWKDGLTGALAN